MLSFILSKAQEMREIMKEHVEQNSGDYLTAHGLSIDWEAVYEECLPAFVQKFELHDELLDNQEIKDSFFDEVDKKPQFFRDIEIDIREEAKEAEALHRNPMAFYGLKQSDF